MSCSMASEKVNKAKTILFLSRLQSGSGNKSTLDRIRGYFEEDGYCCVSLHTDDIGGFADISQINSTHHFDVAIGLHAYHAGQWLKDLACPYILMFGGTDLNECSREVVKLKTMKQAVDRARVLVAFAEHMAAHADSLWPGLKNDHRFKLIPQGITGSGSSGNTVHIRKQLGIPAYGKLLAMVGAIRPIKDQLYLLDEFMAWYDRLRQDVYFVIVGDVMDKDYGKQVIQKINSHAGLLYVGSLSLQDTHCLIQESFALVNSSLSEGQATAILEAQVLRTPVIVRNIPGNLDIVQHGNTGLIYSTRQEFIQQLESLLNDEQLQHHLVTNAAAYVQSRHSIQMEKETYMRLVAQIERDPHA